MNQQASLRRDVVAIGASAGGIPVLRQLAASLPPNFPAAVLIVLHVGAHRSILPDLLRDAGPNPALHPRDGEPLRTGTLYIAPPDHHLLLVDGHLRLNHDAKENYARPAIDPLFRSVAVAAGVRAIGAVLTGRLDDGTAGLQAIKACGGLAVVQDPADAEEPQMPTSARENVVVDHVVSSAGLAGLLCSLVGVPVRDVPTPGAAAVRLELGLHHHPANAMETLDQIGTRSHYTCPDCHGTMWQIDDVDPVRFRCHTGHAFTLLSLEDRMRSAADEALWTAMRALQERQSLLLDMAAARLRKGDDAGRRDFETAAEKVAGHREQLHRLLSLDES